jgi:hypothetical protein
MKVFGAWFQTLLRHPGQALEALFWYATGKRQRARNRLRLLTASSAHSYQTWIAHHERQGEVLAGALRALSGWPTRPRITVLLYQEEGTPSALFERCINALSRQIYQDWELVLIQSYDAQPPLTIGVPRLVLAPSRATTMPRP